MKVLVTGGSGFIGSHLVKELKNKGYTVYILSNDKLKKGKNLIFASITDRKKISEIIPKFGIIYHLAGLLGTSELIEKAYKASQVNILGTLNILDAARIKNSRIINVTKPNCWLNTYSITKHSSEQFVKMYNEQFGLPTISIKWFNVYGPNQSFHCQKAVPFFIKWALTNQPVIIWGNGKQTMDLIHAKDNAVATIKIAESVPYNGDIFDVGSGIEISVNKLAKMIIKLTGSKSKIVHKPMRPGESPNTKLKADVSICKKLGITNKISLEKGLLETINWYRNNLSL